ncbi:MAG: PEP/pyruvate-binding domain-containing protein [Ignavibacteriaceae bacterium]
MENNSLYSLSNIDQLWVEHGYGTRFQGFQNLMKYRIRDILLVSSLYDSYLFEEDGRLYELIRREYQGLNLSHSPELIRVSSGIEAIAFAKEEKRYDLIITTLHIEDMHALNLAKLVKQSNLNIPVVLLAYNNRELTDLISRHDVSVFDKIFIWQGDFRILLGIIKYLEDKINVDHDTKVVGVQSIILIEDNIRDYSTFLPLIYTEILKQSQNLISEGINLSHKFLRMRARPKILLCTNYEEAWDYYEKYREFILGIISDIDFKRNGEEDPEAGLEFARRVRSQYPDIPILLQSYIKENKVKAKGISASFLLKDSPNLLQELRKFMVSYFGFGDMIFRTPDGSEVGRASDLKSLETQLRIVPDESILFHAERNHFSNWLKARTEFWLAHKLRPRKVSDFYSVDELRENLISSIKEYQKRRQRGIITDFTKDTFDPTSSFARIGGGSLGGKARGLGFINTLINNYNISTKYDNILIYVPPAVVLGTDVFDQFLEENDLRNFAISCNDDKEITRRFLAAEKFPEEIIKQLVEYLDIIRGPLAVRSSSLLEDSQYQPFAGVYETYMMPNNNHNPIIRLNELVTTIKRVFASTFYQNAKDYIFATAYRLEEEKMAVIIQQMVGTKHGDRFYPHFSGVAKSHNFYPMPPQKSIDGIASAALGLGKWIVDGGLTTKFCPKYPAHIPQFNSVEETLNNNQREFYALNLDEQLDDASLTHDIRVQSYNLKIAEEDDTLVYVGSTYSIDNKAIYDGISRKGVRIVSFAPILKNKIFPLPEILELLLDMGSWGMGTPVEIEFAVNMAHNTLNQFALLQMRPLVITRELEELNIDNYSKDQLVCYSDQVLGHGVIKDIRDIVYVDYHLFERSKSKEVAAELNQFNTKLMNMNSPYLLIGVGRWGSLDPWLGIPVKWEQISGAKAIIETGFKDFDVTPSQGSHFFHNLTSFMVGYFSIYPKHKKSWINWEWILKQDPVESKTYTKHIKFDNPITIKVNGQKNKGIITKPGIK